MAELRYVDSVRAALAGIADAANGNLDAAVEHCPDFDVAALVVHTGAFAGRLADLISDRVAWDPSPAWRSPTPEQIGPDPIAWHRRNGAALVDAMMHGDRDRVARTWAGDRPHSFWYRRAAQELSVHWWDAEHARGVELDIDPRLAVDGIDEYLFEFAPRFGVAFRGAGEAFTFVADDHEAAFTLTVDGDNVTATRARRDGDVTATGRASDLLLYLWGRVPPAALRATGRVELLDAWQQRVQF